MSVHDPYQSLLGEPAPPSSDQGFEDPFDLSKYLTALRRRWPLLLVSCLVAGAYALIHYSLSEKLYRSNATIQIERKRASMLLGQAGWLEDWWNLEYYPTQYRLLRSRGMAERVVLNLRLHEDPMFNERAASLVPKGAEATPSDTSADLARLASRVQSGLSVNPIKDTQLVELAYTSNSPEMAARIANGYAEVFIEWGIENRTSIVGKASTFFSEQIDAMRQEIKEAQEQLNAYASGGEYTLDPGGEALLDRRQALQRQYNLVVTQRTTREAAYRELRNLPPETVVNASSDGEIGKLRSEIFALEGEYRSKLDTYKPEWPDMVSLRESIDAKKDQLNRRIGSLYQEELDQAQAELQKAKREEQTLAEELQKIASDARLQNSAALDYANQITYIETRKEHLADLVRRQSETEMASRVQTPQESNVRVVDRAIVPGAAFKPSLRTDLSKALTLGLLFGVGLVLLLEYLDRTVKTPEELESLLRLPTLAVIPDISESRSGPGIRQRYGRSGYSYHYGYGYGYNTPKKGDADATDEKEKIELLPHHRPRLAVSEAYRSLRTALLLSSAEKLQVVALTSAEPGEGKTATTTNLGVVLAQLGRRVLILDGDLRRPRLHKVFQASNRVGLVSFLTGNVSPDSLFIESGVPNLLVCPSGPIPPNPSELLASDRMREFLAHVRKSFDYILIDTPPVLPVADAIILGTKADGVVVCARAGSLLREDAKFCRERLGYSDLRLIGAVLNRYSTSAGRYNTKYRYYGVYEDAASSTRTSAA